MKNSILLSALLVATLAATQASAQSIFPDGAAGVGVEGTEEGTPRVTDDTTTTDTTKTRGNGKGKGRKK